MSGAVDCRRRSLGAVAGLQSRDAAPGTVRPYWRKWSVIMCPGEGRGPPRPLQLLEPYDVCGCTCGTAHRAPRQQHREQELRFRELHRRAALLRTFSHDDAGVPTPPTPPLGLPHAWAPSLMPQRAQRVPPLKRHLTHSGAFGLPPSVEQPLSRVSRTSPSSDEQHDSWMPTTRRLLLEPAPHRITAHGMPYGGPALRTPPPTPPPTPRPSAFRPPSSSSSSSSSSYYCSGEIVYELRPGPVPGVSFSVPVYGSMVVRSPQEAGYGAHLAGYSGGVAPAASTALPGSVAVGLPDEPALGPSRAPGPKQCLRVLRPDELEQRKPILAASTADAEDDDAAKEANAEDFRAAVDSKGSPASTASRGAEAGPADVDNKSNKRQWLLRVVRDNFNEQIGTLVERFVRRPRHDKSVRRVPGIGRKVNINLQDFWRRSSGQERHMKTKDLLAVYTDSGLDWRAFQRWLTKDLQFMPSCAKLTALSLDIYQRYWNPDWVDDVAGDIGSPT